jgi:hypothetical protein
MGGAPLVSTATEVGATVAAPNGGAGKMDQAHIAGQYAADQHQPLFIERYAKGAWALAAVLLNLLVGVVNNFADVIPAPYMVGIQGIIGVLTLAGVIRDRNAVSPATVVDLVDKLLPLHTLVPKADVPLLDDTERFIAGMTASAAADAAATPAPAPERLKVSSYVGIPAAGVKDTPFPAPNPQ